VPRHSAFLAAGAFDCLTVTLPGVFFLINRSGRFGARMRRHGQLAIAAAWPHHSRM